MPDPRYRPRDYLLHPKLFGLAETPALRAVAGIDELARARASFAQAKRAYQLRQLIAEFGLTQRELGAAINLKPAKVSRLLNGDVTMSVEDSSRFLNYFDGRRASSVSGEFD